MPICLACGARLAAAETCTDVFNRGQLLEVEQPSYYTVHHLSVPCYMFQHNIYSQPGWLAVRQLLFEFVHEGLTPQAVRRRDRRAVDSGHRTFSFTKGPKLAGVENIRWRFTVAEVRLDTPENYCADVRRWAAIILEDSQSLIPHA
ncbi:MAG: hypothetical protein JNL09_07180 [Anaerolineales bacterium]|nr:hypothetical protein [Anaerolineales bacterium]